MIALVLRHSGGPKRFERSVQILSLPAGSPVLVYKTASKTWEGPFPFENIDGEMIFVQLKKGGKLFRSNCIKPWASSTRTEADLDVTEPREEVYDTDEAMVATHVLAAREQRRN